MKSSGIPRRSAALVLGFALAAQLAGPGLGQAQSGTVPRSETAIRYSYAPLVKEVAPAVVNIYARKVVRQRSVPPFFEDPIFRRFFGDLPGQGAPSQRVQNSLGSGVIVRSDGTIVTNHHVIKDADEITVVLTDRREFDASIVGSDERTDLAVLRIKVPDEHLPALELGDSDALEVGDLVLAIGNPFGVGQTVTSGIVSALARTAVGASDYRFFIQTDAAINPGNSGGALVAMDGKLIGINSAIYTQSGGSVGIGFAVPSNMVRAVLTGVVDGGRLVRPWIGITGAGVTFEMAQSLGLKRPAGVILSSVYPDSPAARAGLKVGDVLLTVDGHEVEDSQALKFRLATLPLGSSVHLAVQRQGQQHTVTLTLAQPPEDPPRDLSLLEGKHPFSGATVANLSPALAEELAIDPMIRGVMVLQLRGGSPAQRLGIQPGDIVARINDREIATVQDLKRLLSAERPSWRLQIRRGERTLSVQVNG
ncbi:MAG: DegQ family serine endoprotease [Proteobacteria bacterium]|nr:DegQ family serine endoprotease [Pseudomonadota bacterium]MBI3496737.1 DegQ family serine endoprotease [Pseudomonadota bacterium]